MKQQKRTNNFEKKNPAAGLLTARLHATVEALFAEVQAMKQQTQTSKQSLSIHSPEISRKKLYDQTPEHHSFVMSDGKKITSIFGLVDELELMSDQEFDTFVTAHKNDFASWIRDVFEEKMLAQEIHKLPNRTEMQHALLKQIARDARGFLQNT